MNLYFDTTATTKVCDQAVEQINNALTENYGNPSSKHRLGIMAEQSIRDCQQEISQVLGCRFDEVIFTSGGTESNSLAIWGTAKAYQNRGKHIITTAFEHDSVRRSFAALAADGFEITTLSVDSNGRIDIEQLRQAITKRTILVSIMQVNNEMGAIQDIAAIGRAIKQKNPQTIFHVDAVQGFLKFELEVKTAQVDLYSASSHKVYGPKGVGFLYKNSTIKLTPLIYGGNQQRGYRAGTENIPGIAGLAAAIQQGKHKRQANYEQVLAQNRYLQNKIATSSILKEYQINGGRPNGDFANESISPYIVSLTNPAIKGEVLLHALEDYGIQVSTGSACSSKKLNTSHVLKAIGLTDQQADKTIRISLSVQHDNQDIDFLIQGLEQADAKYRLFHKR